MCKILEEMCKEARREGFCEGYLLSYTREVRRRRKKYALRLLETGKLPLSEIADMTELSLDEVKQLWQGQLA